MRRSRLHVWLCYLVFLAIVLWPNLAPAPSSGGSMGGSGFGGGGSSGGGDSGALFEILFYLIYYGGHLFFTTTPGFIIFLIIVAFVIYAAVTGKKPDMTTGSATSTMPMTGADVGKRKGGPYVILVQVAFPAAGFTMRDELNQLARKDGRSMNTRAGLAEMLKTVAGKVMNACDTARVAALREDGPLPTLKDLETRFQQVSAEERGRYRRDTVRAEQGQIVVDQKDQLTNQTSKGYVVVTMIAAFGRPLPKEVEAPTSEAKLRNLLFHLREISNGSTVYAVEIVWTPAAKGDFLEEAELLTLFPALKGAGGAQATVFACPFCGASYDAALPTCPSCGGANTGAIS